MKSTLVLAALALTLGLGGCVATHEENAALRMPRPVAESATLLAYAPNNIEYPSVGGDILKGTAPNEGAAYDAGSAPRGGETPPPPAKP